MSAMRLGVAALLVGACSTIVGETPVQTVDPTVTDSTQAPGTTEPPIRDCVAVTGGSASLSTGSVTGDALALSGEAFVCADDVVVSDVTDINQLAAAAQLAAALDGPLLHPHPQLAAELGRLKPKRVHVVGDLDVAAPPGAEETGHTIASAVEATKQALGIDDDIMLPATADASTVVETVGAIAAGDRVVHPLATPASSSTTTPPPIEPAQVLAGLARPTTATTVWLMGADDPAGILSAAATGHAVGAGIVAFDPADVLGHPEVGEAIGGRDPSTIRLIGDQDEVDPWAMSVLLNGVEVPGGGFEILPEDHPRRYVAFYGNPSTVALGVLGEQGPAETLERMQPYLTAYTEDGYQVVPTYEIIASVAAAKATEDGDYSFEWPPESFQPWVEEARDNGMYLLLDLQPGRDDFLTQAKMYQGLLELPYVGLALDPEWRIGPDQVHLVQTGHVEAAEVNEVVDWLADLVRENGLPQKMLLLHQFRAAMIRDRETLEERPELQMIIQVDGQGPIPTKDDTYRVLTDGQEDAHWKYGWKNFFDEDSPKTATPEYTMGKEPTPVYVSYQ